MIYVFGDYELDTQRYELHHAGEALKIEPQVFNVLAYLIQHHDRTVTRQELLDHLWPEQFTTEAVVSYCIMTARKAVGDNGRDQKVIKTLHGRGFRFVATLETRQPEAAERDVPMVPETAVPEEPHRLKHATVVPATAVRIDSPPTSTHDVDTDGQLVTVLCAILTRAAELREQLGFADHQRLRRAFFALAQEAAQRHKGTLQFFGADGILILFGAPVTCEDHARQAVRAAQSLQQQLGDRYADPEVRRTVYRAVRLGLHTGPMATDRLSKDQRIASTEMGETMHLAVWLQYLAEPGTLLISETTLQQAQEPLPCATPRKVNIPGRFQPVSAYVIHEPDRR